jgi:hypothetical protein
MKRSGIVLFGLALLAASVGAPAAKRGTADGDWHTGPFFDPAYIKHWGYGDHSNGLATFSADPKVTCKGKPVIREDATNAGDNWAYFPNTGDMDLDLTNTRAFQFSFKVATGDGTPWQWSRDDVWVYFVDMSGRRAFFDGAQHRISEALKDWVDVTVPVASRVVMDSEKCGFRPAIDEDFDWTHVAWVEIHVAFGGDKSGKSIRWFSGAEFVANQPVTWWLTTLDQPDLTPTYAERIPRYNRYLPSEPIPGYNIPELVGERAKEKHWPDPGEEVTWLVHVKNAGFKRSPGTDFVCRIDTDIVLTDKVPSLDPGQEIIVKVPWAWKQGPYEFEAAVDTKHKLSEITKKNNTLTFRTDAYTLDAVCEKSIVEPLNHIANWYNSFCFENWMTGATVDKLNGLFRHSKYDFATNGAEVSVRLDKIFLVDEIPDDGAKIVEIHKGLLDGKGLDAFDGTWHYPYRALGEWIGLARDFDWALNHELSHQLGLIDDYNLDLGSDKNKVNGKPYAHGPGGMMGGGLIGDNKFPAYADMDIAGLNFTKGQRRGYFGEYLYMVPTKNTLILSAEGKPLAEADVEIYKKTWNREDDSQVMQGPAWQVGKTDENGRFVLENKPVPKEMTTATGCNLHPNPFGYPEVVGRDGLLLVRGKMGDRWYYEFVDIGRFLCEYARGHQNDAYYTLELKAE